MAERRVIVRRVADLCREKVAEQEGLEGQKSAEAIKLTSAY